MLQLAKAGELSAALVAFLVAQGGRAPSTEVVSHFSDCVTQADAPLFRHLLHQVRPRLLSKQVLQNALDHWPLHLPCTRARLWKGAQVQVLGS